MKALQLLNQTKIENDQIRLQLSQLKTSNKTLTDKVNQLEAKLNITSIHKNSLKERYIELQDRCELITQELVNWRSNYSVKRERR
jgi:chromosome segregation ATPase